MDGGHITINCINCGDCLNNNIYPCALKRRWYLCKACYNHRKSKGKNNISKIAEWKKSLSGKLSKAKSDAKRRNLQWIKMFPNPFADNVEIDWHHITDVYVVAIPRDLHRMCMCKRHREKAMDVVKQIYLNE